MKRYLTDPKYLTLFKEKMIFVQLSYSFCLEDPKIVSPYETMATVYCQEWPQTHSNACVVDSYTFTAVNIILVNVVYYGYIYQ